MICTNVPLGNLGLINGARQSLNNFCKIKLASFANGFWEFQKEPFFRKLMTWF